MMEFTPYGKIYRWNREWIITEKIDGTNAQILIEDDGSVLAGSRNRWLSPEKGKDNFGFAGWVEANKAELVAVLGPGRHFGEWWGKGIQRGYDVPHKIFSLFNVGRWEGLPSDASILGPGCISLMTVPVLGRCDGVALSQSIEGCLEELRVRGSAQAPGFNKPEGIVAFHVPSKAMFKRTIEKDEEYKGRKR